MHRCLCETPPRHPRDWCPPPSPSHHRLACKDIFCLSGGWSHFSSGDARSQADCLFPGLPGQLPQLCDDVVEQEVVAPVHDVDQEEHEREEHQRYAVHAVAPGKVLDSYICIVVGEFSGGKDKDGDK